MHQSMNNKSDTKSLQLLTTHINLIVHDQKLGLPQSATFVEASCLVPRPAVEKAKKMQFLP